ncbi:putative esterase [Kordia sp. SMS9]|uniref:hotdog fold thioesterase n=1 Tax=Kordia sp. SMS9 TaxID=2282170 RepID=UPI000E0CCFFF|nr:hotdog fold thioesterase [Kordia sp. SMS9]AXG71896.1 putative esterase [Kordia sp. SMS9]
MNPKKEAILAQLNAIVPNTLLETLQITYTDVGEDFLTAKMPVNPRVHQPQGLLHGGATVALAETVGSTASHLFIDATKYKVKGLEISANHLKSKREGEVFATARFIHKGRTTHLWEIRVVDEEENLISLCKLTTIVLAK